MKKVLLAAATLALIAAACSSSDGASADGASTEVRPFAEIQDSDLVFENDASFPGRGIFHVTTTEPAICAIVWGETEALGNFNNSLNMNGTGIIQHDVFLPGAESSKTYFYRVQGSTADGTLYQSDVMSFTLPEGDTTQGETAPLGINLATGGTVTEVSSEFSAAWAGTNAIDDDLSTEWSSAGDGDESFITIDLGETQSVAGFEFLTRTMADGSATTTTYTVTVDDGDEVGPFPAGNPADTRRSDVELSGRVFRFDVTDSTGGNTGAIEIRIIAPGS